MNPFAFLSVPEKKVSAWVVETTRDDTAGWLARLSMANSSVAAQDIYQALFTLNRMTLEPERRCELLELYRAPLASVSDVLHKHLSLQALPLSPRRRQLAEFIRQLQDEMAFGYKLVLIDLGDGRAPWSRGAVGALAAARAVHYLAEVLLRSYQVYMPCPPGVWKELHGLYLEASQDGVHRAGVSDGLGGDTSIERVYLQAVLLGLCGPYQLPQNECLQVQRFLRRWSTKAVLSEELAVGNPTARFVVDLSADFAAVPYPTDVKLHPAEHLRVLNAVDLARTAHDFLLRLQKGAQPSGLGMGVDCLGTACMDMLRRMVRFWGLTARRQFSRRLRRHGYVAVCAGVPAVHFFADGQRPFASPSQPRSAPVAEAAGAFVDLDALDAEPLDSPPPGGDQPAPEVFRVDRWQLRDESAGGLSLLRTGESATHVRVGDLLGFHDQESGYCRIGVARWLKSPQAGQLELGVEMLAPTVTAVAVKPVGGSRAQAGPRFSQALMLPAVEVLRQPATLIVSRGTYQSGQDLILLDADGHERRVRPLKVLERTGSFEQLVVADASNTVAGGQSAAG